MRRRLLSLLLALVLFPLNSGSALAIGTLDQEALPNGFDNVSFGPPGFQTFTAGLTGDLDMVSLHVFAGGGTWNVAIKAVAADAPTGPDLATGSAPVTPEGTWSDIVLTPVVPVTAGTQYAIVVTPPMPFWSGAFPYAGGVSNNPFTSGGDLAFRTYVTVPVPPEPPLVSILVESTVALTQAGGGTESVTAPTGSTVWRTIRVVNNGATSLAGISLVDSGGALPASCAPVPSSLAIAGTYSCTFGVSVGSGTTAYTTTATSGNLTSAARSYVTGTLAAIGVGSKLGLPATPGDYTPDTQLAALNRYVTWRTDLGAGAAGKAVGVYVSRKRTDGRWGAWSRLTARVADSAGVVVFSRRETKPAWLSVRFSLDGDSFTNSAQARWR